MDLNYQEPAIGVTQTGEFKDAKSYKVYCECGSNDHAHDLWVESEDSLITVTVYVKVQSPLWSMNRWKQMWQLFTRGYLTHEANLIMNEQVALNYAETIKVAIEDVKALKR